MSEQQSATEVQLDPPLPQHEPPTQLWPEPQQVPLQHVPEQQLLSVAQEFPADVQTQVPLEQRPEQQSVLSVQPESLLGIQATQVLVVLSQTRLEQQSL
ncbi:MAG: hypothetical protein DME32_16935 [Verrucomicrobia bacterium]|nr:MAG: hypothetical protein DME32_16935 [Verrucomicrobiota bacterium]